MNVDQLRLIKHGLEGPFGKWLFDELKARRSSYTETFFSVIPQSIGDLAEREQYFGRINEISDLIRDLPTVVNELLKTAEEQESNPHE